LIADGTVVALRELRGRGESTPPAWIDFGLPGSPDQSVPHAPKWLDFTQFELNPYFTGLFADEERISVVKGRIDIALRRDYGAARVYDCHKLPEIDELKKLIGPMYFTSPPCKKVSIGVWRRASKGRQHGLFQCWTTLIGSNGLTVDHILSSLQTHAESAVDCWDQITRVQLLCDLPNTHWKHDIWNHRGVPILSIVLRNHDSESQNHWLQTINMEPRVVRQGEWMPKEMMKPPVSTSPDVEQLLPGLYNIGIREPILEDQQRTVWHRLAEYERVLERIVDNVGEGRACSDNIPQGGPPVPEDDRLHRFLDDSYPSL
jgi:hypothetical protein